MKSSSYRFFKGTKGISTLVATLLIIAVAIAVSAVIFVWLMPMLNAISQQSGTLVRIDTVEWIVEQNMTEITIRNIGSVVASIESVSIRLNEPGKNWYVTTAGMSAPTLPLTIQTYSDITVNWTATGLKLESNTAYIIKVTCTSGYYYEYVAMSP